MLTLIRCPFHPRVTAVARKRPRSFCPKCSWQVITEDEYTLDPTKSGWAVYVAVQALSGNLSGNELTCNSSRNTRSQSSQLAEPLQTDPSLKNGISVRELISASKIKKVKKRWQGINCRTFSQNPRTRGKSHHHHHNHYYSRSNPVYCLHVVMVALSSRASISRGGSTNYSPPAVFFFFFFWKWRSARAQLFHFLGKDQSTVAQRTETITDERSLTSCC